MSNIPITPPEEPPFEDEIPSEAPGLDIPGLPEAAEEMGGEVKEQYNEMSEPLFRTPFGEAPVSFHTTMFRPSFKRPSESHWVTMTVRGEDPIITFDHFCALMSEAENNGWTLKDVTGGAGSPASPNQPSNTQPVPPPSNAAASTPASAGRSDSGTDVLHKIIVVPTPSGGLKTDFYVGRFRYPMSDSRSSDIIAGLFDPQTASGWTPAHFEQVRTYDLSQHNYVADWEKVTKPGVKGKTATYYNVLLVKNLGKKNP